jgi:hypothetical protein
MTRTTCHRESERLILPVILHLETISAERRSALWRLLALYPSDGPILSTQ